MSSRFPGVSDMLVTVKSRQAQRALLAEMRQDRASAIRHFLAAAHLELVIAADYDNANVPRHAFRSRIAAASCLWRGGQFQQARDLFDALRKQHADKSDMIQRALDELNRDPPALAS